MVGLSERVGLKAVCAAEIEKTCQACGRRFMSVENERICPSCNK